MHWIIHQLLQVNNQMQNTDFNLTCLSIKHTARLQPILDYTVKVFTAIKKEFENADDVDVALNRQGYSHLN